MSDNEILVLLVEDDDAHAELVTAALQDSPQFSLCIARSLEDARQFLRRRTPDIVFSDLILRDGVGSQLLPKRPDEAEFPTVLMTSYGSEATAVDVMKQGAFDYLIKSERMFAELPRTIERTLREWQQVQMRNDAERALRRSEEHLRMALEAASVGTWEWDPATDRISYQLGSERSLGIDPSTLRGSWNSYLDIVAEEDRPELEAVIERALAETSAGREEPYVVEHRLTRIDDDVRWVQLQGRVIRDATLCPVRVAGTVVDITARKLAESRLHNTENQLAHITRVATMGEMLSGIAHELNHPLYTIKNYGKACANLIDNQAQPDLGQVRDWLDEICSMADHAGEMIRRMRNYVKKETSKREWIGVDKLITTALSLVRFEAAKRGIGLSHELPDEPPELLVDAVQIEQVLVNLIRNAFEAMQQQESGRAPKVHVLVEVQGSETHIVVRDNGPGVSAEQGNGIFDAFVTSKSNGLGLGLAIARNLVEAHRGRLVVEHPTEGGAAFRFTLPTGSPENERRTNHLRGG